jgi:hypothetical protein
MVAAMTPSTWIVPTSEDDQWLSYFGHPILPCGFNADDVNGDDYDGPGTNWPVSPVLFDTFEAMEVVIITEEMLAVFEGCGDYVVPSERWEITWPCEVREIEMRKSA